MRAQILAISASVLANMAFLNFVHQSQMDASASTKLPFFVQQKQLAGKQGVLQFEFIESPNEIAFKKPQNAKKISDKDSLAQDLTVNKDNTTPGDSPSMEVKGAQDQLAQTQMRPGQIPSSPIPEVQQSQEKVSDEKQEKEIKNPIPVPGEFPDLIEQVKDPIGKIADVPKEATQESLKATQPTPTPPVEAVAPVPTLSKIMTQGMAKTPSKGAQLYGYTSFEATGSGMGAYMKNLKEQIWLKWFPYLSFKYPADFKQATALLQFTLDRNGVASSIIVLDSKGGDFFPGYCVEAVKKASPFGPLPPEILALVGKDTLDISFSFYYS